MSKIEDAVKLAKILSFLEKYEIENATINKDLTVDVDGIVFLSNKKLTKIPIQFGKVAGLFDVSYNKLTSLEGCPRWVGGSVNCNNNNLTSLKGCPKYVKGYFNCRHNPIKNIDYTPQNDGCYFWGDLFAGYIVEFKKRGQNYGFSN